MKSSYVARAEKMMREFVPIWRAAGFDTSKAVDGYNKKYHRHVEWAHGIARHVLVTSDYVVKWDYNMGAVHRFGGCKNELRFYNEIKHSGYSYLFAEITKITARGFDFYVMPRVDKLGIDLEDSDELADYLDCDEADFVYEHLNDMHSENWGVMKNGDIVIIDYAMQAT